MFLKALDLTTALRPSLLPDETLLFVQDAVGLYEGYVLKTYTGVYWTVLMLGAGNTRSPTIRMVMPT